MKWCLVAAGLKDLTRPADKLSVSQNLGAFCRMRGLHLRLRPTIRLALVRHNSVVACLAEALTATGFIWVRYSFVIIPVNYSLAAV